MGREIRRVPMDFDWPLDRGWDGFVNPHFKECPTCGQSGQTAARELLENHVSAMINEHSPPDGYREITSGLAGRDGHRAFGHDAIDRWAATKAIIRAASLDPDTWGICPLCNGEGIDPSAKAANDAWEPTDPPAGPGYQVWETVSEGSPISPVFATSQEAVEWLEGQGHSRAGAQAFVDGGWAPSLMVLPGRGVLSGVDAMGELDT